MDAHKSNFAFYKNVAIIPVNCFSRLSSVYIIF